MSKCSRGLLARKYDELYRVSLLFPMELLLLEEKNRNSSFRKQSENQARNQGGARCAFAPRTFLKGPHFDTQYPS